MILSYDLLNDAESTSGNIASNGKVLMNNKLEGMRKKADLA
jgi:hypothetical protein